ncbi:hypothetical protein Q4577_16165 [Marinovum sp. 2_MG-2023]|nr:MULTISPECIES: hypothetical protein [Roseobacteraceae]MDO6731570.1 hypothetical protein [Marinovum sp. 2_MG-2023]MDO6778304.1 hypothetical protein [Marinovum sp. 1_MG-2023]
MKRLIALCAVIGLVTACSPVRKATKLPVKAAKIAARAALL